MTTRPTATYRLDPTTSSFVLEQYNWAPPLSNFLPGIAGKWGIPLWLYYVNRGQALSSLGVRDKDGQIVEFQSFNQACMRVAREGFRTFVRLDGGPTWEPFQKTDDPEVHQTLTMAAGELVLLERNNRLGIEIEVLYFPLPNLPVAALARRLTVKNLARRARRVEIVDGLPRILPFGLDQKLIKGTPRHAEAMMGVAFHKSIPIFRLRQTADDSERVGAITGGNFYVPFDPTSTRGTVVDPEAVFGEAMAMDRPWLFEESGARGVLKAPQLHSNKTPCAMSVLDERLKGSGELTVTTLVGYVRRDADLDPLLRQLRSPAFLAKKRTENVQVIDEIGDHAFTVSSSPAFDAYARQNFLDNVIRGGLPMVFDTRRGTTAFYVYSRQNGDLERDYHHFVLEPTYLSQGTGHYRSVLQNRRTDTWFFPQVDDANLRTFLNLIQLDGYNPLEVRGLSYAIEDPAAAARWVEKMVPKRAGAEVLGLLRKGFTPGELLMRLEELGVSSPDGREALLAGVLRFCRENEVGGLHEGFWVDHWHYNLDLIDIYRMVYPDRVAELFFGQAAYTWFDNPDVVLPRSARTVDAGGRIRAFGAVVRDPEKLMRIRARKDAAFTVRTRGGKGEIHRSTLFAKVLTLVVNRLATLDPAGTGVEMEAGKPGWNDSMNGLPGLFGSGLSETLELRKAVRLLQEVAATRNDSITVHEELAQFMDALQPVIKRRLRARSERSAFQYWDAANSAKEAYREATRLGVTGVQRSLAASEVARFLAGARALLDAIFEGPDRRRVLSADGVPNTYFVNEVTKHRALGAHSHLGLPTVEALGFRQRRVKLFLEGAVHWMKDRPEEAKRVHEAVRRSAIYDRTLKMFKSCEPMAGENPELGRAVGAYPPGWIENESIYLHMEYKYLLELIRSGLCEEFWRDAKSALMPFMDPAVYGRSTLEGASFIVSSAYADGRLHGRAFQPRLSGITCEMLHIWILAVAGEQPFRVDGEGNLELALAPRLPAWMFTAEATERPYYDAVDGWGEVRVPADAFAFKLMSRTLVVYHNATRGPTYGKRASQAVHYRLTDRDGREMEVAGAVVPAPLAHAVRDGAIRRIDVTLA